MPRPPMDRHIISRQVSYVFLRQALERPTARAQRCPQCGYWVREVPCAVCRAGEQAPTVSAPATAPRP